MYSIKETRQKITGVDPGSPAARCGIEEENVLLSINGEPVFDLIDYEYLSANAFIDLVVEDAEGIRRTVSVKKAEGEPLGLNFETSLMSNMKHCANGCVFCFVDQMPSGLRPSLSVKDDDWRLSFIMGNYVTLTNVTESEFERILARRVSPLYVSVHATDPEVRSAMMGNRNAGKLLSRLQKLKENGLHFHAQVVLCPGLNDGPVLERTLTDLEELWPACESVAIVPVGLTRFREKLTELRPYTKLEAESLIDWIAPVSERLRESLGTRFVFLSDEWYLLAGRELPGEAAYESYDQIENGVGLLRLFESDFRYALEEKKPLQQPRRVSVAGGTGCAEFFRGLYAELSPYGVDVDLYPVPNRFFGGNVNVAGLVTGGDIFSELSGKTIVGPLLIPQNMLRENDDVFLDDLTVTELSEKLGVKVIPFANAEEMISLIFGE